MLGLVLRFDSRVHAGADRRYVLVTSRRRQALPGETSTQDRRCLTKDGRLEGWKDGMMEGWKQLGNFQDSTIPSFQHSAFNPSRASPARRHARDSVGRAYALSGTSPGKRGPFAAVDCKMQIAEWSLQIEFGFRKAGPAGCSF